MRPISVRFQCFGPYKKETFVDFEKLEKQGLFLICGETGAGKTTILDAICYALYGKSSGGTRGDLSTMRCKLAEPSEETKVEFTFEVNGKCYRFVRSLRYGRKNLLDSHNCMVLQGEEFVPIFENPKLKNVNQKAEELLGLTHEQFRQVVMLPQGQFERLLISDSAEKEKILVSLFQAEKWQNIAEEMYRRVAEREKELKGEIADINSRLSDYRCTTVEELKILEEEAVRRQAELEERVKAAQQEEVRQKKRYESLARQKEMLEEWQRRRSCVEELEKQNTFITQIQEQVTQSDRADKIKQEYELFCKAKVEKEDLGRKINVTKLRH